MVARDTGKDQGAARFIERRLDTREDRGKHGQAVDLTGVMPRDRHEDRPHRLTALWMRSTTTTAAATQDRPIRQLFHRLFDFGPQVLSTLGTLLMTR